MDISEVKTRLGLNDDATDEQVAQSLDGAKAIIQAATAAGTKLGLHAQATPAEIVSMLESGESTQVTTLRGKLETMGQEMHELRERIMRERSELWMDGLRTRKFVNEKIRPVLLSLHMQNPEQAQTMADSLEDIPSNFLLRMPLNAQMNSRKPTTGLAAEIERNMA